MSNLEPCGLRTPPKSVVIGLIALALLSLIADGFFQPYAINGDVTAYFDIADQIQQHHWNWVVNGYWNPLYPALLWLARLLTRADVWHEMQAGRLLNVVTALLVLLASAYLADSALRLSLSLTDSNSGTQKSFTRIPRSALLLSSFAVTFWLIVRNLNVNTVRPDLLLTLFLLVAFASMFDILREGRWKHFVILGVSFGLAYLTKSVAFPVFAFTLLVLGVLAFKVRSYVPGIAIAVLSFAVVAGPYIGALSKKEGHFSSGESGSDNYAWYVDGAERFEQQHGQPETKGAAIDHLKHTSQQLLAHPGVYYYGNWMPGTETQWFDPSYWNAGLTPKFSPKRQISVLISSVSMFVRVCLSNAQTFLPLILTILIGGAWKLRDWSTRGLAPIALIAVALLGLYMIVLFEGRYVAPSFVILIIGSLAFAYFPAAPSLRPVLAYSLLMLLAALVFTDIQTWTRAMREQAESQGTSIGSYKREIWTAARALSSDYGIEPGDTVACYGEGTCRDDLTWARLAHTNIRTEVYVPQAQVATEWNQDAGNPKLLPALRSTGAKVLVAKFPSGVTAPAGWVRLGAGDLFAFDLRKEKS